MAFSSVIFLFYFLPAFFILYYLSPKKLKNPVLLLSSALFYCWGGPVFVFVILGTTLTDYVLVRQIHFRPNRKLLFLGLSLALNLGLLFYFKYFNFLIQNLNSVIGWFDGSTIYWEKVILPIGISFYTFESVTYMIDVYRGEQKPLKNFWDYQMYILLFPKLIAGPIVQFKEIAGQIQGRFASDTVQRRLAGLMRFIVGLSKKVLIANTLGEVSHQIYDVLPAHEQTGFLLWVAAIAYTFQIYFDFSGYSDMALGLCLMMGFTLSENFNFPYISGNITEYWRRWHMTLGAWMKNYLYIPLGGNKTNRVYRNLIIVFLVSGIWHGASWNFVIWGIYHGVFLILDRLFLIRLMSHIPKFVSILFTLFIIMVGWVIFRIESMNELKDILSKMFSDFHWQNIPSVSYKFYAFLLIAAVFSMSGLIPVWYNAVQDPISFYTKNNKRVILLTGVCLILGLLSLSAVVASDFNPFIYFRF